jgi:tetratricopeptide (TPR) repeat protein
MKVFLSSTGRDLTAHRESAFKAIQGMGHHCVRMEDFHGPNLKIEDFDDQRVAECDLFVIVIGHLHGTCPDGSDKSYTELEYDKAQKLGKTCYLFVAPEDFLFPANLIESDAKRERQRIFRQTALKGVIRSTFTSAEDLATQIAIALPKPNDTVTGGSFLPTPPQPYFVHPYPLQENFTGRRTERRMLTDWLTGNRPVLSLCAIGGMGKSALTWAWVQRDVLGLPLPGAAETDGEISRVPEVARPEGIFWWSFYEREATFAAFVREALRYASAGRARYASPYEQLQALATILPTKRLVLVLEGFERELRSYAGLNAAYQGDQADEKDRRCINPYAGAFLRFAASQAATRVLLTTRLHPEELDGLAGCQHKDLTSMDPEDAVHFFHAQGVKGTRAEIQRACAPYGYHPLALRLLAGHIVKDHRKPGDIQVAARHPVTEELKGPEKHHILEVAYDAMERPPRELLGSLAAFRSPMSQDSLLALNPFKTEGEFDAALDELIARGLLLFDPAKARYDLHPVVRKYAYDRLTDKAGVHARLRDYFARFPAPEEAESLDELARVIELYHHTLRVGLYDEALRLYRDRLNKLLYFRIGAHRLCVDLLRGLFPDGEDQPPRLTDKDARPWTQNELAHAYSRAGQPTQAIALYALQNAAREHANSRLNLAVGLASMASALASLGQLRDADRDIRRSIGLCQDIKNEFRMAVGHEELGLLEAYQGRPQESSRELDAAVAIFRKLAKAQPEGIAHSSLARLALLTGVPREAVRHSLASRELAAVRRAERDVVQAEWLLGWSLIHESSAEAETHLTEALTRCRQINLVEFEPDILLAFGRLRLATKNPTQALADVQDALAIADRCEYRLVQADCHNMLAQLALDSGDRATALHQAEIAKERAYCDGPPHYYKSAYDTAESTLNLASAPPM